VILASPAGVGFASVQRDAGIFLLYLIAAAVLHFPHYGLFVGDITRDFYVHYNWTKEFAENIALGNPYPRWMFHGRLGLGEPVFIFYAPLYYFAVALVALPGISAWVAMQVVAVITTTIFGWFIYKTCTYYADVRISAMVGFVALTSPFIVMLNYKFDGLAWATMGYASHGFLFWALFRPGAARSFINVWAAVAIAIALGSHIVSALLNIVCYSVLALFPVAGDKRYLSPLLRSVASWGATVAVGLALNAIYLVPALLYLDVIRSDLWTPDRPFTAFSWPVVTQFFYPQFWFSFQWTISLPALALVIAPLVYVFIHRDFTAPLVKAVAVGVIAVFFASELSFPMWSVNTPLLMIQLPFRFVSVAYTMGAVSCGLAMVSARAAGRTAWYFVFGSLLGLCLLASGLSLLKAGYLDGKPLPAALASGDYTFSPFIERLRQVGTCPGVDSTDDAACLEMWAPSGSFRGTPEYRLQWAGPDYASYAKSGFMDECATKGMTCGEQIRTSNGLMWSIDAVAPNTLVLPLFDFPSWSLTIDGQRIEHTRDAATGLIAISVPAGAHEIEVAWKQSSIERYGLYISILALVMLCVSAIVEKRTIQRLGTDSL
jgi:hypothetical protein